ncbi:hypothetical protein, partial [Parvibaculum sp.]|uniref:hypothetical protein n=1 Tax=Parvibaculum sp. TaxID=2024848 RepID=UPI0038B3A116
QGIINQRQPLPSFAEESLEGGSNRCKRFGAGSREKFQLQPARIRRGGAAPPPQNSLRKF